MNRTRLRFEENFRPARLFRGGVSLHSHTLHSRETLDFIYRLAKRVAPLRWALEKGEAHYLATYGGPLDLARAWWTPPASPHDAWALEAGHIRDHFGLEAMVSITDHDDIDAPLALRVLDECRDTPVSVEWTVPYAGTFFHLGIHNLAASRARETMEELAAFSAAPRDSALYDLLARLASNRETLIVFNHPYWDEKGIGEETHRTLARQFVTIYKPFVHAFELNGLRPSSENRMVFELSRLFDKPLISGGDRHALEPNTILNLTNAGNFDEFVEEVRDGYSEVLFARAYSEPFALRILQSIEDILSDHEHHALGWRSWSDRVFYQCEDGVARSLKELWGNHEPAAVRVFLSGFQLLRQPHFKQAFRMAFARREEVV